MDKEANTNTARVREYLKDIYGAQARNYFTEFGLVSINNTFKLPTDREAKVKSLVMMIDAIEKHNLSDRKYGKQYWTALQQQYNDLH